MKQTHESYNVGIYCRLSRDDGHGESSSISSQKLMLTNYVKERNWRIVDYYCEACVIIEPTRKTLQFQGIMRTRKYVRQRSFGYAAVRISTH